MPYLGLLLEQYGTYIAVYSIVFDRYMRRKKFAWPDEVKAFNDLYRKKHPELIRGHKVVDAMFEREIHGAVYVEKRHGFVIRAFGKGGVLAGDPYTPKDKYKDRDFFRLTLQKLIKNIKSQKHEDVEECLFFN